MDELFDVFDEDMIKIGTATRTEVHRLGIWHQTFHCWIVSRDSDGDSFVLQRRHSSKDTHPNKLDMSCAGHLAAGEIPSDGIRELREELGLDADFEKLHKVGVFKSSDMSGGAIDNEFCHVFVLIQENAELTDFSPATDEVSGLYLIRLSDMKNLCFKVIDAVTIRGFEIADDHTKIDSEIAVTLQDMVEQEMPYYEALFAKLEQDLCETNGGGGNK